jgi:hypothetical protein
MRKKFRLFFISSLVLFGTYSVAEPVLITHSDSKLAVISQQDLKNLWLGYRSTVNDLRFEIIDLQEGHPMRVQFYQDFIGYSVRQLKAHWATQVFRGNGFPPARLASETDVIQWISAQPNRLGYIDSAREDGSIKIIILEE